MDHLTLLELNQTIKSTLEGNLDASYWVVAEIGEMRQNQTGHCYLELVEKQGDRVNAKLRATIWSYTYRNLSVRFQGITGQPLQAGMKVLCNMTIQFHEMYGLSANIKDIDANYTVGERARKRQEVINKLVEEGVFDMNKTTDLPLCPQNIAIISSPTAAGYGDFMHQLDRNQFGYKFTTKLFNAVMQGEEAKGSIINAMHLVNEEIDDFDMLVIIRGGGSQIDLDCFDAYELAFHVAQFPIPVVTGIGHERDESVVDMVAHTKMKTPTAVSEFLISGMKAFEESLDALFSQIYNYAETYIQHQQQTVEKLGLRLMAGGKSLLLKNKNIIELCASKLKNSSINYLQKQEAKLEMMEKTVDLLNPRKVLKRGYSITTINNKVVKSDTKIQVGDNIQTETVDKIISSTVESIKEQK